MKIIKLLIASLLLIHTVKAQDTLRVSVGNIKTDTTFQVRIRVKIDTGWTIKEPVIDICCFKNSRSAIRKIEHIGGYDKLAVFVIHIPLVDLIDKEYLDGSITLIPCKGEDCADQDTRHFKVKIRYNAVKP